MVHYVISNDQLLGVRQVDRLGVEYPGNIMSENSMGNLTDFPFTRCCFSIGDWAIVSALPKVLKYKYPNMQFWLPKPNWIRSVFQNVGGWTYQGSDPALAVEMVFKNNPYVKWFDVHEFSNVITDHERSYRYDNEPLVEQILRMFGFTEEELSRGWRDYLPDLYFSDDEIELGNKIIEKYIGDAEYGCMLFASRLEHLNNCWDINNKNIQNLFREIYKREYHKDYKIFYYSAFPIEKSYWADLFNIDIGKTFINFAAIPECTQRIQWYIKTRAKFNISYQAGFNDATTRYSNHLVATHRIGTGETTMRGVTYFQNDGSIVKYE